MEEMEEVELSSDEEQEDEDEVALIVLKRPPITERVIEEVEVGLAFLLFGNFLHQRLYRRT